MAMTPDEMTPDKAVRYACRALTEERERVAEDRYRTKMAVERTTDPQYRAYGARELADYDERLANIDAAMRVLNGLVGR
jgi:hypothetical protein